MKILYISRISYSYESIIQLRTADENDHDAINLLNYSNYVKAGKYCAVGHVKFEFSQDFIDGLYLMTIQANEKDRYNIITYNVVKLYGETDKKYEFMFKFDKAKIHFWKDADYIIENLVEKFDSKYIPIAKQVSSVTYLALGRI